MIFCFDFVQKCIYKSAMVVEWVINPGYPGYSIFVPGYVYTRLCSSGYVFTRNMGFLRKGWVCTWVFFIANFLHKNYFFLNELAILLGMVLLLLLRRMYHMEFGRSSCSCRGWSLRNHITGSSPDTQNLI